MIALTKKMLSSSLLQSNLAITLWLLPRSARQDAFEFYTFCHNIDDCIDHSSMTHLEKERFLTNSLSSLEALIQRRHLDKELLNEILLGMKMDLSIHRYQTFQDLRLYIWRVASVVGLISAHLFGAKGEQVLAYAENLGIALQLTNILRDIAEDAAKNRIYLPLEDLHRFHVTEEELLTSRPSPQATHLFHYEAERALSYFAKADLAWEKMPLKQRRIMRPARLMEAIYRTLLEKIQRTRYDVFYQRYRIGFLKKLHLAWLLYFSF